MENWEKKKRELLEPILLESGAALMDCQGLEYGIALLIFHLSRLGMHDMNPNDVIQILEDKEKKTA